MGNKISLYNLLLFFALIPNFTASQILFQVCTKHYNWIMYNWLIDPLLLFLLLISYTNHNYMNLLGFWWTGVQLGVMEEGRRMVQLPKKLSSWTGYFWDYSCLAPSTCSLSFWRYTFTKNHYIYKFIILISTKVFWFFFSFSW